MQHKLWSLNVSYATYTHFPSDLPPTDLDSLFVNEILLMDSVTSTVSGAG